MICGMPHRRLIVGLVAVVLLLGLGGVAGGVAMRPEPASRAAIVAPPSPSSSPSPTPSPTPQIVRILAVGDSITVGFGSSDGAGYRSRLTELLAQRGITAQIDVVANGGLTLDGVTPRAIAALAKGAPDVVLLAVGTNDAAWTPLGGWRTRYMALVDRMLAAGPQVRVACAQVTISDRSSWLVRTRPTTPANERMINGWVGQMVAARSGTGRVVVADMSVIPSMMLTDGGVHPGDAGYQRMAEIWLAAIATWLPTP
jgi:lysophospholipase L1-like esterase